MITADPFSLLSEQIPPIFMQMFVILMFFLVLLGTIFDMVHKKNVKYFFQNAQKAKKQAKINLSNSVKTSIIFKTISNEILTTSELGRGKRRVAHLLGMYGTIIFWIASVVMIFVYSDSNFSTPVFYPIF